MTILQLMRFHEHGNVREENVNVAGKHYHSKIKGEIRAGGLGRLTWARGELRRLFFVQVSQKIVI